MTQDSEKLKQEIEKESKKLGELGTKIAKIQFSYKVEEKSSKEYWEKREDEFKQHSKIGAEYYYQAYSLMELVNKKESKIFLLQISKFNQLSSDLTKTMKKIKENPSIGNSKDKQQSIWSKEIRQQITNQSNECLDHEKKMNVAFREFYEKNLRKISQE